MEFKPEYIIVAIQSIIIGVVFFTQKSEISKLKTLTDSMSKLLSVFSIDEIEKMNLFKDRVRKEWTADILLNDSKVKNMIDDIRIDAESEWLKKLDKEHLEKHEELLKFVSYYINSQENDKRESVLNNYFPKNKDIIQKVVKDF